MENFGTNVCFEPAHLVTPHNENDVLACLEQYRDHKIRAVGRLHSWSEAPVSHDVVIDLRHLDRVSLQVHEDGSVHVQIEAGCTIDRVLAYLRSRGGYTLPTYGIVGKQTIAGAIATATHGSGRPSLSHYVSAIRVAAYDRPTGKARTYDWDGGEELRAARCGLGCTGIVLSVRVRAERDYLIEERTGWFERIEQLLEQEPLYPRQQFYLVPWSWRWYGQLRRPLLPEAGAVPSATARTQRVFRRVGVDVLLNGAVRVLSGTLRWRGAIRGLYRRLFPLLARPGMRVTDRSYDILMMRHDFYAHVEMELFVPAPDVSRAAAFVEWVLRRCGGESLEMPDTLARDDFGAGFAEGLEALTGRYVHDYPITFRRVLRDDALVSMTSGPDADAWYAISLLTYWKEIEPFLEMAAFLSKAMAVAYRARPHWGKICPLDTQEIAALYPDLPRFRAHCASVDPGQVFVNDFARRVFGF